MTEYSLSEGLWWLVNGNDLEVCYSEKQNGADPTSPICYDLTGTDYVGIATSENALLIYFFIFLAVKVIILRRFWRRKSVYLD